MLMFRFCIGYTAKELMEAHQHYSSTKHTHMLDRESVPPSKVLGPRELLAHRFENIFTMFPDLPLYR